MSGRVARVTPFVLVLLIGLAGAALAAAAQTDALGFSSVGDGFGAVGSADEKVVTLAAQFTAPAGGQSGRLFVTATIKPGWHIYSITQPRGGPVASVVKVAPSPDFRLTGDFQSATRPDRKQEPLFDNIMVETHQGTVTWSAPLTLSPEVDPAQLKIKGTLKAQPCDAKRCLMPQEFPFTASRGQGVALAAIPPLEADTSGLVTKLIFAFLGGLILNLMPCVLPVISLKVLSFLDQAGESRGRVFMLNLWYAIGLLSVFMVLAALAASAGLAWGEQFTLPWFKVAMTGLVFAMALSFLGVWELPIPGFAGAGQAMQLQIKEGAGGAFFKGVFATILATPCSGPFLGPVFGYLLTQPPHVVYMIFGAVGLGMASPYLVIGAFPQLIRVLPRPGAWMETVKQLMAFLLLGTVVYLFSTLSAAYFLPTLTLLIGIWFGCWLIGRTPLTAEPMRRAVAWIAAIGSAAVVGLLAFVLLFHQSQIAWQPFSPEALAAARADGKTVMVDFTADWCLTCKANLKLAIDTKRVRQVIGENQIVPLIADWTDKSPAIKKALNELGRNSIPVLAIWPPQGEVIVLSDLLGEGQVIEALKKAGPSRPKPPSATAALEPRI